MAGKSTHNPVTPRAATRRRHRISMHEDVPVWHDCCSCEAEPYWTEAMAEEEDTAQARRNRKDRR